MDKKFWISIFLAIIIFFGGTYLYLNNKKTDYSEYRQQAIEEENTRPSVTINTKYQYKDGQHFFVGSFEVPNPCYESTASVKKGDITEIVLSYSMPEETDKVCAEVITEVPFAISFEGPQQEDIIATLNGEVVSLNIFELDPKEDINTYIINIKG